jgi:hypothetical protein
MWGWWCVKKFWNYDRGSNHCDGVHQVFIIILYENVFQNPELFWTQVTLSPIENPQTFQNCLPRDTTCKVCIERSKDFMMFPNFFSWPYFWNLLCFSSYPHHSTIPQPSNFIRDCSIRLLGQKRMFTDKTSVFDLEVLFYCP